jgi:hypothetical protein
MSSIGPFFLELSNLLNDLGCMVLYSGQNRSQDRPLTKGNIKRKKIHEKSNGTKYGDVEG